jgi:hypothetical protein
VSGVVVDQYGRGVAGASVVALTGPSGSGVLGLPVTSGPDGAFTLPLVAGAYRVYVEAGGRSTLSGVFGATGPVDGVMVRLVDADAVAPSLVSPPVVSGQLVVGGTVSVDPGTWPPGWAVDEIEWLTSAGARLGTGASITVPPSAVDATVEVRVVGSLSVGCVGLDGVVSVCGFAPVVVSVPVAGVVAPGVLVAPVSVGVSGVVEVGGVLSAVPGVWGAGVSVSFQWLADGVAIPGATGSVYSVRAGNEGQGLAVMVVGSAPGYAPVSVTSAVVGPVPGVEPVPTVTVEVPGPQVEVPVPGPTVRVEVPVPSPGPTVEVPGPRVEVPVPGPTVRVEVAVPGPTVRVPVLDDAGSAGPVPPVQAKATVRLSQKTVWLVKGSGVRVPVVATGGGSGTPVVSWTSKDSSVVSVSASGLIRAKRPGKALVVARVPGGAKAVVTVRVVGKAMGVSKVSIRSVPAGGKLAVGATVTLRAKVHKTTATRAIVRWSSSRPDVATIDAAGRLHAKQPGTTTITLKAGTKKTTTHLTITP